MSRPPLIALIFAGVVLLLTALPPTYVAQASYIGLNAIVCIGLVLLAGVAGLTSFGQAAFVGIGAYTTAYLTVRAGISPWLTLPLSLGLTGAVGWLLGSLTIRLSNHYLVLATLAWGISLFYLLGTVPALGGFNGLANLPELTLFGLSLSDPLFFTVMLWIILGFIVLGCANLLQGRTGRALRSLRSSTMAESMGVDTAQLKIRIFIIAAMLAALTGWLQAHYLRVVAPSSYNANMSLDYLFMTVIGGWSHPAGAIIGPLIFELVKSGLRDLMPAIAGVSGNYELAVFGILMIVLLQRASGGVMSFVARWLPAAVPTVPDSAAPLELRKETVVPGAPLLRIHGLTKTFGGLVAVNNVGFEVSAGEIVGIIGPNGAGKSTLFNLITGSLKASSGTIELMGQSIVNKPSRLIARSGVSRTFQHVHIRPAMSAIENVALGAHTRTHAGMVASALRLDRAEERQILFDALTQLERVGLSSTAQEPAGTLALGQQRLLEIARALAADPKLLILDEPAAGLRHGEKAALASLLKALREQGVTILIVEHDMSFVMDIVDRLVVIEFGTKIAEGTPAEIQVNPKVIEAYLGSDD